MSATAKPPFPLCLCLLLLTISLLTSPATSATDSFIFGGCSQIKYLPGSPFENGVSSMLTSFVNSAMFTSYNNFTLPITSSISSSSVETNLYGLFQCRGDLDTSACSRCVARAVSQLGSICSGACGGALQLDGCFVKYDNSTFLGVEDKTVVLKKCGPPTTYDSDMLTRRDAVLGYVGTGDEAYKPYRVGWSGNVQAVAQCVQDLSPSMCQDCVTEAIGQLKAACGPAQWGDMFLGKCYARYTEGGERSRSSSNGPSSNDDEVEKTLAILIGLIAGVALIVVLLSLLAKVCDTGREGK